MQADEVRIEILKILVPAAAKVGLTDPSIVIEKAKAFETYVLPPVDSEPAKRQNRGRKKVAPSPD